MRTESSVRWSSSLDVRVCLEVINVAQSNGEPAALWVFFFLQPAVSLPPHPCTVLRQPVSVQDRNSRPIVADRFFTQFKN